MAGHLKLTSGHLTKTASEHLAVCGDCECTIARLFSNCNCLKTAYGTKETIGSVTFTITGTPAIYPFDYAGRKCPAPAVGPSLNGTYVVDCGVDEEWWAAELVCTGYGLADVYYLAGVQFRSYNSYDGVAYRYVTATLRGEFGFRHSGTPTPPSTPTKGPPPLLLNTNYRRSLGYGTRTMLDDWTYELGGTCAEECNWPTTRIECPPKYPSLTSDTNNYGAYSKNAIEIGDINIAVEIDI